MIEDLVDGDLLVGPDGVLIDKFNAVAGVCRAVQAMTGDRQRIRVTHHGSSIVIGCIGCDGGGFAGGAGIGVYQGPFAVSIEQDTDGQFWLRMRGGVLTIGSARWTISDLVWSMADGVIYLEARYDDDTQTYTVGGYLAPELPTDSDHARWFARIATVEAGVIAQIHQGGDIEVLGRWVL